MVIAVVIVSPGLEGDHIWARRADSGESKVRGEIIQTTDEAFCSRSESIDLYPNVA